MKNFSINRLILCCITTLIILLGICLLVLSSCREQSQEESYSATSAILSANSVESDLETYDSIVVPQSTTDSKLAVLEEEKEVPTSSTSVSSEKVDIAAETKTQAATDTKSSQTTQAASLSASQTTSVNLSAQAKRLWTELLSNLFSRDYSSKNTAKS